MLYRYVTTTDGDKIPFLALKDGVLVSSLFDYGYNGRTRYNKEDFSLLFDENISEYNSLSMNYNALNTIYNLCNDKGIIVNRPRSYDPYDSAEGVPYITVSDYDESKCLKVFNKGSLNLAIMCGETLITEYSGLGSPIGYHLSWGFGFFSNFINGIPQSAYYIGYSMRPYSHSYSSQYFPDSCPIKLPTEKGDPPIESLAIMLMDYENNVIGSEMNFEYNLDTSQARAFYTLDGYQHNVLPSNIFANEKGDFDIMDRFSPRVNTNMIGIYPLDKTKVAAIFDDLWTTTLFEGWNYNLFGKPTDNILSLKWYYGIKSNLVLSPTNCYVKLGNIAFNGAGSSSVVTSYPASTEFCEVTAGSCLVPTHFINYLDYEPYTKVQIYIPFHGIVNLNCNEVIGQTVTLKYNINLVTGISVALVYSTSFGDVPILIVPCEMSMEIPVNLSAMQSFMSRTFDTAKQAIASGITAGVGFASTAETLAISKGLSLNQTVAKGLMGMSVTDKTPDVSRGDNAGSETGCLSSLKPSIIITRPINLKPTTLNSIVNHASTTVQELSSASGFTKAIDFDMTTIPDNKYIDEILSLLQSGIYI